MSTSTSVVIALFFAGFFIVMSSVYPTVINYQNLGEEAQHEQITMRLEKLQTDIKITNVSFSNISGKVFLNITVKNTGKTTLNAGQLDIFIDGNYIDSSYCLMPVINTWVSENTTNISIYSMNSNITKHNISTASMGSVSSITWPHTVGSGLSSSLLVVGLDIKSTILPSVTGITYAGVDLKRANFSVNGNLMADLWYLIDPAAGTNNIVVTFSNTAGSIVGGAVSFSGVDQANPIPTTSAAIGSSNPASTQITTANLNSWIIDTISGDKLDPLTPTSPQTELWDIKQGSNAHGGGSTKTTTTPGLKTMDWSPTDKWAQVVAEIKPLECKTPTSGRIKVVTENGIWDYAIVS